ncbi:MAG: hypothetical protein R6V73_05010 [Anaerolineales bacterium]
MKKISLLLITILLVSTLAACAGTTSPAPADSNAPVDESAAGQPAAGAPVQAKGTPNPGEEQSGELLQERDLPDSFKLALGSMKLEETDYPITAVQAQSLLPYWKALSALSQSDTAAIQEVEAVLKQIQAQMSAEQLAAIDGMEMTMADLTTLAEKLGLTLTQEGMTGFGSLTEEERATRQAARDSGQMPGSGMGPGGGMGQGGGEIPGSGVPLPNATQIASGLGGGAGLSLGINPRLLAAVIQFLELRASQ